MAAAMGQERKGQWRGGSRNLPCKLHRVHFSHGQEWITATTLFPNMQPSQRQARCKHSPYDGKKKLLLVFFCSWCKEARDGIKKRKYGLGAAAAQSLHLVGLFPLFLFFPLQLWARMKLEPSRRFQIRFCHLRLFIPTFFASLTFFSDVNATNWD